MNQPCFLLIIYFGREPVFESLFLSSPGWSRVFLTVSVTLLYLGNLQLILLSQAPISPQEWQDSRCTLPHPTLAIMPGSHSRHLSLLSQLPNHWLNIPGDKSALDFSIYFHNNLVSLDSISYNWHLLFTWSMFLWPWEQRWSQCPLMDLLEYGKCPIIMC